MIDFGPSEQVSRALCEDDLAAVREHDPAKVLLDSDLNEQLFGRCQIHSQVQCEAARPSCGCTE